MTSELRVRQRRPRLGGLGPGVRGGAKYSFQFVARPEVADHEGDADRHGRRGARGRRRGRRGRQRLRGARGARGRSTASRTWRTRTSCSSRTAPTGTKLWTRSSARPAPSAPTALALDAAGHPVVTGYTKGNLDGAHAGNTSDDVFVVKFDPAGTQKWVTAVRRPPAVADRGYAHRDRRRRLDVYVTGYTRGVPAARSTSATRTSTSPGSHHGRHAARGSSSSGAPARTRAWGASRPATASGVGGMTSGALGTPRRRARRLPRAFTTRPAPRPGRSSSARPTNEEVWGVAADASGNTTSPATPSGDLFGTQHGDKDIVVARSTRRER